MRWTETPWENRRRIDAGSHRQYAADAFAPEKLATMRAFGAELNIVPRTGGRITPDLIPRMIEEANRIAESEGAYWTDQFH